MRKAALLALAVFVFVIVACTAISRAEDKKTLTVTAVTHNSHVNERTSYHTTPGQSATDCSGTGTDSGAGTTRINMDCNTTSTPPKNSSITTRTTDVTEKVIDSASMVYTIVCSDRPNILAGAIVGAAAGAGGGGGTLAGSGKCAPLTDGDQFDAEIKGTTMWAHARKGGNQGKAIKIKYKILDIRKLTGPAMANNDECWGDERDANEAWRLGRRLGMSDTWIADAIRTQTQIMQSGSLGVCRTLSYLRRADADRAGTSECRGDKWDEDRALSLGASVGEKRDEIMDAFASHGVCRVLVYLQGEAAKKAHPEPPLAPDLGPPSFSALPPFAIAPSPSAPTPVTPSSSRKSGGQSLASDTYAGVGGGHWVSESSNNGRIITLEDDSLWEIAAVDRANTALWLLTTNITVLVSQSIVADYTYVLINKDDGEKALAKYLGSE